MEERFKEGIELFNSGKFFQAHVQWEKLWLNTDEGKSFIQDMIQIVAAYHHYLNSNTVGALMLLERGLSKISEYPKDYHGIDAKEFTNEARGSIQKIKEGSHFIFPVIKELNVSGDRIKKDVLA